MNTPTSSKYWGRACGLMAGCAATTIGIAAGLDPEVIVWRATVAAVVIGLTVTMVIRGLVSILNDQ